MRRLLPLLACLMLFLPPLIAVEDGEGGDTAGSFIADSDGAFRFSVMPTIEIGRFTTVFNFSFKGEFTSDAPWVDFDLSNFQVPERLEDESRGTYGKRVAEQYLAFIYSMHFGGRYDPFYFRYGKLENITLGDGALLSAYYDNSVGYLESRPGFFLNIGPWGRFGQSLVIDDILQPSLFGWRAYIRPFANKNREKFQLLNPMEWGLSIVFDPRSKNDMQIPNTDEDAEEGSYRVDYSYRSLFETSLDVALPLFSGENGQTTLFADYLLQGPHHSIFSGGRALRAGLWGYSPKGLVSFNTSITTTVYGTYYTDYFSTGYNDPDSNEYDNDITVDGEAWSDQQVWEEFENAEDKDATHLSMLGRHHPLKPWQFKLDSTLGLSIDSQQVYSAIRFRSVLDGGGFGDQRLDFIVRIDKLLYHFISLDLNYEKNYPSDADGSEEAFFSGLATLENVYITMHAQIKWQGIKFILGGKWDFDAEGKAEDPAFDASMQIVIF